MTDSSFFLNEDKQQLFERLLILLLTLIFVGFVSSRAFISIGVGGLFILGIYTRFIAGRIESTKHYVLLLPVLFIVPYMLSYLYSDEIEMCNMWLVMKLPFLILPFAFWMMPPISSSIIERVLRIFVGVVFFSTLIILYRYFNAFDQINDEFLRGGSMPVPFSHIRYSLILVFSFFSALWLYLEKSKRIYSALSFYLFILIHILSVRSGLVAIYFGLLITMAYLILKSGNWKLALIGFFAVIIVGWGSFKFIPSLKNRLAYMNYDYGQWKGGKIDGNSDAMRMASLHTGLEIWKQNFWIGTSTGDILAESKKVSKKLFPEIQFDESRKMPHNQFLWILSSTGVLGLLFFVLAWLLPLWSNRNKLNLIVILFHSIMAISFMVEYTLEEQVGGTFFMIFSMFFLKQMSSYK